jgi:hypothetical protein
MSLAEKRRLNRIAVAKYRQTEKGKAAHRKSQRRYSATVKGKATEQRDYPKKRIRIRRYQASPKGIETRRRHRSSAKGYETARRYSGSPKNLARRREHEVSKPLTAQQRATASKRERDRYRNLALDTKRDDFNPVRAQRLLARMYIEERY